MLFSPRHTVKKRVLNSRLTQSIKNERQTFRSSQRETSLDLLILVVEKSTVYHDDAATGECHRLLLGGLILACFGMLFWVRQMII